MHYCWAEEGSQGEAMFRKRTKWYTLSLKALFFAGILYRFARFFMKSADKIGAGKRPKK